MATDKGFTGIMVGYARVSKRDQNLQLQLDALTKAGCKKVYQEKLSGAKRDRPELLAALEYLREGDVLVVWKLDRLARSISQLIETMDTLEKRGIGLISLTQQIDTTTAMGKLFFRFFAVLSAFERDTLIERTVAGLDSAREQGRVGGRKPKLTEEQINMAKGMLRVEGVRAKDVAKQLGISVATLYRYIPNAKSEV